MTSPSHGAPQDPVSAWLARTFPRQHVLRAEIAAELRRCSVLLLDPPNKSLFGDIVEFAIGLTLGDQPSYLQLFDCLDLGHAQRLLTTAGYQPTEMATLLGTWRRIHSAPHPARIFNTASRLAHLHCLRNDLGAWRPDVDDVTRLLLQRNPDLLDNRPDQTFRTRCWFRTFWYSYTSGFQTALRSYGPSTAQLSLLHGHRRADFLLGTTLLEVKSGRLDRDRYLDNLIRQLLTYALLAHHDGHPVTHVAAYAARYQRLLRYPIQELTNRLAGAPLDLTAAASHIACLIRDQRPRRDAT